MAADKPAAAAMKKQAVRTVSAVSSRSVEVPAPVKTVEQKQFSSGTNPISDEAIDKALPAPFNEVMKANHGHDREIYKQFSEAPSSQDWDIKMQNKLNDAILSSPYANALTIDSILCKGNICEVRVFEFKNGVWPLIMAEMKFQTWWEFGANSNYGFAMMKDSKLVTGNLALFVRE